MPDKELQEWLDSAARQGRFHSQGSFTLDSAAAARKFGQYALQDPLQIVARLLRAGVLANTPTGSNPAAKAPSIEVELSKKSTVVHLPGYASGAHSLGKVFDQVLSAFPEEREFSIAVNSIVARPLKQLTITRCEPSKIGRLKMGNDGLVEISEAYDLTRTEACTRVEWAEPGRRSVSQDLDRLGQWFRYSRIPITLNGKLLEVPFGRPRGPGILKHLGAAKQILLKSAWYMPASYYWADHHAVEFHVFSGESERNEVGLPTPSLASARLWAAPQGQPGRGSCFLALACGCDQSAPGRIDWVYRGQLLDSCAEDFSLAGVTAVVACEGLPFDITGEKLIHGPAYEARRQFVRDWANCLEDFLHERYPGSGPAGVLRALFDSRLCQQALRLPPTQRVTELLRRLSPQNH